MRNTLGNSIQLTVFGESHGPCIGGVIDGLPAGLRLDEAYIADRLDKRRAKGSISTGRQEADQPEFISGVKDGYTEGSPLAFVIRNENIRRSDYDDLTAKARPAHADYAASCRYHGFEDRSGGGHFSGRLTAVIVCAGAILQSALENKDILIGTHIASLYDVQDERFNNEQLVDDIRRLNAKDFAVLNDESGIKMKEAIETARTQQDSLGGILETAIWGLQPGIGEPLFDSLEGMLSRGMFAIGGIKGIEFGSGFALAQLKGSQANDQLRSEDGKVITLSNHNGGINGGLSNGMPLIFRTVVKPTPSIARLQKTIDLNSKENTEIEINGRHDPAIIHRARVVQDAMSALVVADALAMAKGNEYLL